MTGHHFTIFDTAIGRCGIVWGARGIVSVQLPMGDEKKTRTRLHQRHGDLAEAPPPANVQAAIEGMVELLAGKRAAQHIGYHGGAHAGVLSLRRAHPIRPLRDCRQHARQAKVGHFGLAIQRDHDVVGLEVAMHNRRLVDRVLHAPADLDGVVDRFLDL